MVGAGRSVGIRWEQESDLGQREGTDRWVGHEFAEQPAVCMGEFQLLAIGGTEESR